MYEPYGSAGAGAAADTGGWRMKADRAFNGASLFVVLAGVLLILMGLTAESLDRLSIERRLDRIEQEMRLPITDSLYYMHWQYVEPDTALTKPYQTILDSTNVPHGNFDEVVDTAKLDNTLMLF